MDTLKVHLKTGTVCPLANSELTSEYGVEVVAEPKKAHWIIAPSLRYLVAYSVRYPLKHFLLYTNEPVVSSKTTRRYRAAPVLRQIEIMNVFTGDVFWNNSHFLGSYHFDTGRNLDINIYRSLDPISKDSPILGRRKVVATFFTYRLGERGGSPRVVDGIDRDLEAKRCAYAVALNRAGICDVYGAGWPAGISREDSSWLSAHPSREKWWSHKLRVLSEYRYNLCLENTAADWYCTEKIWHAIQAGTLPIYWGANTRIFDTFPRNSFIDISELSGPDQLIERIKTMSEDEYVGRMNACRATFNTCISERRRTIASERKSHIEKVVARLRQ